MYITAKAWHTNHVKVILYRGNRRKKVSDL